MSLRLLAAVLAAASLAACGSSGEPQAVIPIVSATPEDPNPKPDDFATLDILCEPPTPVLVDGKPIGKTPITAHKVTPGRHDVTFADEETGNRTMTVDVGPGEGKTVKSDRAIIEKRDPPPKNEKKH